MDGRQQDNIMGRVLALSMAKLASILLVSKDSHFPFYLCMIIVLKWSMLLLFPHPKCNIIIRLLRSIGKFSPQLQESSDCIRIPLVTSGRENLASQFICGTILNVCVGGCVCQVFFIIVQFLKRNSQHIWKFFLH